MHFRHKICLLLLASTALTFLSFYANAQQSFPFKSKWVDSVYNALTEEQRIGQLFMVAAYSGGENYNETQIVSLLQKNQIGGLIFMQGTAEAQAKLTNKYQALSKVKLMIGMDAEWGMGMRLTGAKDFPKQMMIGASRDTTLMYNIGKAIAKQCNRLGVHVNFAPVVDVNNNPKNPVINFRSFGEDKVLVAQLGIAYMKGLQDNGVMACAKHFPGHGDVAVDSHLDLPIIKKSKEQLQQTEFYPFQKLSDAGVKSMMIAHLSVPALDNSGKPTTLSKAVVTDLLKKEIGYKGLIFTDALNMKGVTKSYAVGEVDLEAFKAGNDVLLFSQNVPLAISKIQFAAKTGVISKEDLEARIKKVLGAKYDLGLYKFQNIKVENATNDINKEIDEIWVQTAAKSITLAKDKNKIIDKISNLVKGDYAYININGNDSHSDIFKQEYPTATISKLSSGMTVVTEAFIQSKYAQKDAIIVAVHNLNRYPGKNGLYGLSANQIESIKNYLKLPNAILVVYGNPYILKSFCNANATIVTYEDNQYTRKSVVALFNGKLKATGTLPVKPCAKT